MSVPLAEISTLEGRWSHVWLVRHGQTEWSQTGQHTGLTDIPLTEEGERQAQNAKTRLGDQVFEVVLSSPLQRALKTASILGYPKAQVEPNAVEWNYGDYEGLTKTQIREQAPDWTIWNSPVPGGETIDQVTERADSVIAKVRRVSGNVLLVAHGHFLRVFAARWMGQDPRFGEHYQLDTAAISILGWNQNAPTLQRWNA